MQLFLYNESITLLKVKRSLPASHPLSQLSPFISNEDILCVGGRLRHSDLHSRQKFPTILLKDHPLTLLILRECHSKTHHQGRIVTTSAIRDSGYCIQNSSNLIKKYLKNCVTCQRLRGSFMEQIMNDLPADRLAQVPPFENSAVDVFSPYTVADGATTRSSATKKCWALLFTCLVSRAVYLEPLPAMDVTAFKNAFRRFVCLRGSCKLLRSDRGTNFIGSCNQDANLPSSSLHEMWSGSLTSQGLLTLEESTKWKSDQSRGSWTLVFLRLVQEPWQEMNLPLSFVKHQILWTTLHCLPFPAILMMHSLFRLLLFSICEISVSHHRSPISLKQIYWAMVLDVGEGFNTSPMSIGEDGDRNMCRVWLTGPSEKSFIGRTFESTTLCWWRTTLVKETTSLSPEWLQSIPHAMDT